MCCVQELILNNDLKHAHQFLVPVNLMILGSSKDLVDAKLLVIGKLLADGKISVDTNLFSVDKHLAGTKHLI